MKTPTYEHTHKHMNKHTHEHTNMNTHEHTHTWTRTHMNTNTHEHTHTWTHTHMNTHTNFRTLTLNVCVEKRMTWNTFMNVNIWTVKNLNKIERKIFVGNLQIQAKVFKNNLRTRKEYQNNDLNENESDHVIHCDPLKVTIILWRIFFFLLFRATCKLRNSWSSIGGWRGGSIIYFLAVYIIFVLELSCFIFKI